MNGPAVRMNTPDIAAALNAKAQAEAQLQAQERAQTRQMQLNTAQLAIGFLGSCDKVGKGEMLDAATTSALAFLVKFFDDATTSAIEASEIEPGMVTA